MNRTMNILKNAISYLPFISILLIIALFPFRYGALQRTAMYSLAVVYVLDYFINCRWLEWQWSRSKAVFLIFCLFPLLTPIWQLFDPLKTSLYQTTIDVFAPFFFIGIAGFAGMTDKIRMDYIAWVMLSVSVAICGYLAYMTTQHPFPEGWICAFNWFRAKHINSHMVVNLYFNMSLILGAMVLFDTAHSRIVKGLTGLLMLPVIAALLITEGRTGLITWIVIVVLLTLYYTIRSRRWGLLAVLAVFCVAAGVFVGHNERMQEALNTKNPRIEQWKECFHMIEERPLTGYGVCSARAEYVRRIMANEYIRTTYIANEVETYPEYRLNGVVQYDIMHPHNAFLETWSRYGIIGLLLCLLCIFAPMGMRINKYQIYLTLCVLAFLIQALFESFGSDLQPLFLASMPFLFDCNHRADIAKTAPAHM